jgi:hypothetical protein
MKHLLVIIIMFYCGPLLAHPTRDIGLFIEHPVSPADVAHSCRIGLQFRYSPDLKKSYRFSASVGELRLSTWELAWYSTNDTSFYLLNSWFISTNMPIISTGVQWNRKLSKRINWYYGTDVNMGVSVGKKDSITHHDYVSVQSDLTGSVQYASVQHRKQQANIFYAGLQPFTGFSAEWNRISAGIEVSGLFVGSIIATTHEHLKSMRWGGFNLRVLVGYSLRNRNKKAASTDQ